MNPNNEHSSNTDAKVSAAYREVATEIPPSRLDDIVLRHAAEETRQTRGITAYLYSFRRPLAFAATLVLALGIVLQFDSVMTGTTLNSTNGISAPGDASAGAGNTSAVVDANAEQQRQHDHIGEVEWKADENGRRHGQECRQDQGCQRQSDVAGSTPEDPQQ